MPESASATVPARAALAGNPSDGYGGAVLAVCIEGLAATVTITPAPRDHVEPPACAALVQATVARFRAAVATPPVSITVTSTIPREVGLAGSSAIVIATLRALGALCTPIPEDDVAATALAVEVTDLRIAAGPQDRIVQARGGLVAMDFANGGMGTAASIDPQGLPPLLLAWLPAAAEPSGTYHADLRARFDRGDPTVRRAMATLRTHGLGAADAARRGDHQALAAAMNGSYDARASLGPLNPRHVALVDAARAAGLSANYAGSGGAIIATGGPPEALTEAIAPLVGGTAMELTPATRTAP